MTTHKNIYIALAAAQSEMGPVVKGAVNPHFRSKYADLADVMQVALPALNRHGIAAWHSTISVDGVALMRTTFSHGESDTHINCDVPLIVSKNDMQGMKSATTYAKRIGVESLSGIAPEDDDGNSAVKAAPKAVKTVTPEQYIALRDKAQEAGVPEDKLCEMGNCDDLQQFPAAKFDAAIERLDLRIQEAKSSKNADLGGDEIPYQGAPQ